MVERMHSQIIIPATAAQVRKVFLDFPSIPTYSTAFAIQSPTKASLDLIPGDPITFSANGTTLKPVVTTNTPTSFSWQGSMFGLLTGKHLFEFVDLEDDGTGERMKFVQSEVMSGVLGFMFLPWWPTWFGGMRGSTLAMFERFNEDLKKKLVEG